MKLKSVDFESIKISFEFQNKIIIINAEPFKTFEEIKSKALNKFMEIPSNIHFYYMGQDLSKYEKEKIGTIFNHKEQAKILLRLPQLKIKSINKNNELLLNDKKKINFSPEYKHKISFLNTQLIPINNKKKLYNNINLIKSQDFERKNNDNSSYYINKIKKNKTLIQYSSMPNLNNSNKKKNTNTNKTKKRINIDLNLNYLKNIYFCDIHNYRVTEYCRTCKKYICSECRLIQEHKNHLTIKLNYEHLEETVKLYTMLVQTNEKRNLEIINRNAYSEGDEIIDYEILNKRYDSVTEKCDQIINNYNYFMKKIEKKLSNDKKNYKTIIINTFNDIASKISKQIYDIVNNLDNMMKKDKKLSIEQIKYFFDEIATKEETLEFIGDRTIKYLLSWEIHNKIENAFDIIENTLDEILNEDRPFNLDNKYNKELLKFNVVNKNSEYNQVENKMNKGILRVRGQRRNGLIFDDS